MDIFFSEQLEPISIHLISQIRSFFFSCKDIFFFNFELKNYENKFLELK